MILCLLLYMYTVETLRVRWRYTMSNMFSMSNYPQWFCVYCYICRQSKPLRVRWRYTMSNMFSMSNYPQWFCVYCYICTQSKHYVWGEDIQCLICLVCQTIPNDSVFIVIYVHSRVRWRYTCLICLVCQTIPNDSVFIVIYVHSRNITCEVKIYNV